MNTLKPNSHRYKEEHKDSRPERKVDSVVKGKVKTKKKNEVTKLKDIFISEDVANVKSYILMDVLVPAVKKVISDVVRDGIDMILWGESGKSREKRSSSYVSYRDYSKTSSREHDRQTRRSSFDYDDLIFESRGEAEAVLNQMCDMIDRYGIVTVADMYDMADLTHPYTSNKYGWTRLGTAEVVRSRDGYIIKLPRAMPID